MVRSTEYTPRRRMAMQAFLCAALGLTVVLAWWVSRGRAAGLEVKLGPPVRLDNKVMSLEIRAPVGWAARKYSDGGQFLWRASEPQTKNSPHRTLTIAVRREEKIDGNPPSPEEVAIDRMGGRMFVSPPVKFDFVGHSGVMLEFPVSLGQRLPAALCACTVITGDKPVSVTLELEFTDGRAFVESDIELLESVAKSLTRVETVDPKKAPSVGPDPDLQ